jgi:hypothetical protein
VAINPFEGGMCGSSSPLLRRIRKMACVRPQLVKNHTDMHISCRLNKNQNCPQRPPHDQAPLLKKDRPARVLKKQME